MAFFRKTIANRRIAKKIRHRDEVSAINLNKAKSVLIVFSLAEKGELVEATNLIDKLRADHPNLRDVHAVGYYDKKDIPEYFKQTRDVTIFYRKQINFFFLPKKKEASIWKIFKREWDIIIDLTGNEFYPVKRMLTEINGKFLVGLYSVENEPFYDLMIKTDQGVSVLSEQAVYYLKLINKDQNQQAHV